MKKTLKIMCVVLAIALMAGVICALAACDSGKVIMVWGPSDHKDLYLDALKKFEKSHKDQLDGYHFEYAGSGDSGAYSAMNRDPTTGAGVYTFANDQMANLKNLGALAPLRGENLQWSIDNNDPAAVNATILGEDANGDPTYVAYPLQADNGYYMYYNKAAFRGTAVWNDETDSLKDDYTFRDLYAALDQKGGDWANGLVTWALGDSWYVSGVFFAVGGNYSITYNDKGQQSSSSCWFSYTDNLDNTKGWGAPSDTLGWDSKSANYTVGRDAYECLKNTFTNVDGTVNKHYLYSDGDKDPLNDYIDDYTDPNSANHTKSPMAAAICGTWKAKILQTNWGDDYGATILPMLETDDGEHFRMKNFRGYKHMGVNPMCEFAQISEENLQLLHELAQYLCSEELCLARFHSTGAGPALNAALANDEIKNDPAISALNRQYNLQCVYPTNYSVEALRGKPIDNGLGFRDQDSVPANYWTPIQNFGNTLFKELNGDTQKERFLSDNSIKQYLAELQSEIYTAAQ